MTDKRRRFSNTEMGDLADQIAPRLAGAPPSRAEFERLEARVDGFIGTFNALDGDVQRLDERQKGDTARLAENDRRLAEALAQVTRTVREVDKRNIDAIDKANRSIGSVDASAQKAHSRIDRWSWSLGGGVFVITCIVGAVAWIIDHLPKLP